MTIFRKSLNNFRADRSRLNFLHNFHVNSSDFCRFQSESRHSHAFYQQFNSKNEQFSGQSGSNWSKFASSSSKTLSNSTLKATNLTSSLEYCANLVRRADYESYLCVLLLPAGIRFKAFVIRAFNCELATIRDQISNKQTGLGRLQFWSLGLNMVYDNVSQNFHKNAQSGPQTQSQNVQIPQQPVLVALNLILNQSGDPEMRQFLPKQFFQQLIDARIKSVGEYDMCHATLDDLDEYGVNTFGACANLTFGLLKIDSPDARQAACYASQALAIINVLRSFYPLTRRNSLLLPLDALRAHNLRPRDALRSRFSAPETQTGAQMRHVTRYLVLEAEKRLQEARRKAVRLPRNAHYPLLFTAIVDHYLKILSKIDYNLFDPLLQEKNNWLPWQLWWKKVRRTY